MYQKTVIVLLNLIILGVFDSKCQIVRSKTELEQLEAEFQKQFDNSNTWILTQIKSLPSKYITIENHSNQNDSNRKRITTLHIYYAHILTERGFDLDFEYGKINCFGMSVIGLNDDGRIEKALLQNQAMCEKKELYYAYMNFKTNFRAYYKAYYRKKGFKFAEIKNLVSDFYKDKSQVNMNQVVKMLKISS